MSASCRPASQLLQRSTAWLATANQRGPRRLYSVVVFGTDGMTLPTLRRLHEIHANGEHGGRLVESLSLVCPSDRPAGRGHKMTRMPAKEFADEKGIPTLEVPYGL
jgi:hypothetical protein